MEKNAKEKKNLPFTTNDKNSILPKRRAVLKENESKLALKKP